jgi:hypothetical protein
MSNKAQALVWDLECPKTYGEIAFKPSHKYVLVAYADHADHHGKNIWPAVPTIAKKTGLDDRTVQRLTHDLETIGLLIEDGMGPRGTNKWKLPYSDGGDKLSPRQFDGGDKNEIPSGDIPSGDIPSGDNLPPELKEPEPIDIYIGERKISQVWAAILEQIKSETPRSSFNAYLRDTRPVGYSENTLTIQATAVDWLTDRATRTIEHLLVGITGEDIAVRFVEAQP